MRARPNLLNLDLDTRQTPAPRPFEHSRRAFKRAGLNDEQARYLYDRGISVRSVQEAKLANKDADWAEEHLGVNPQARILYIPFLHARNYGVGRPDRLDHVQGEWFPRGHRTKRKKFLSPADTMSRLYLPPSLLQKTGEGYEPLPAGAWEARLFVTEGPIKALAASQRGLPTIALSGVWNWKTRRTPGGESKPINDLDLVPWGRLEAVYFVFDSDVSTNPDVQRARETLSYLLKERGARAVYWLDLPAEPDGRKNGLDDYLVRHGVDAFEALVRAATKTGPAVLLPLIIDDAQQTERRDLSQAAMNALIEMNTRGAPSVFRRAADLVDVFTAQTRLGDELRVRVLTKDALSGHLRRAANWRKGSTAGEKIHPPAPTVADIATRPQLWTRLPTLLAVAEAPIFDPQGRLLQTEGYHPSAGVWIKLDGLTVPPVPERPAAADVKKAKYWLLEELLGDFPFVDDASRANMLALILMPFVRHMIEGRTPLHALDAPSPGTGKGLLASVTGIVATGRDMAPSPERENEAEWRKALLASLRRAASFIFIDNVKRTLDSGVLSNVLTSWPTYVDRVLGISEDAAPPVVNTWVASGNNMTFSDEIARRTVLIRIDAGVEEPGKRSGFKHEYLAAWAREHRGELIHAALTLVQAWITAGKPGPAPGTPAFGTFEEYRAVLGGILHHVGVPGFYMNADALLEKSDLDRESWIDFFRAWDEHLGAAWVTTADVAKALSGDDGQEDDLVALVLSTPGQEREAASDAGRRRALGKALRSRESRVTAGWRLTGRMNRTNSKEWRLTKATAACRELQGVPQSRPAAKGKHGTHKTRGEGVGDPCVSLQTPARRARKVA